MKRNLLTLLCFLYGGLLLYASLMPFDFTCDALTPKKLASFWSAWPIQPSARISGADVASNLALYIPLGWFITVRLLLSRVRTLWAIIIAILIATTISAAVEGLQFFTLSRVASSGDWLLNTVSGTLGAIAGAIFGKPLWIGGIRWYRHCRRSKPENIVILAVTCLLVADALAPYLPTIQLKQVWRNLKASHFDLMDSLARHPWHWWVLTRGVVYATLTMLIAGWNGRGDERKRWGMALVLACCLATGLELVKPFIISRTFSSANVITAWGGALAGCLIGVSAASRITSRRKLEMGIAMLVIYEIYLAFTPFNFVWDVERIKQTIPKPVQLLPLYHYAMGATLDHARLFVQNIFLQILLVALIKTRFGWFAYGSFRKTRAAFTFGLFGLCLEAGQMILPTRTPSMTDVYCFAVGAWLGAWLKSDAVETSNPAS